jgi:hypothetical protein
MRYLSLGGRHALTFPRPMPCRPKTEPNRRLRQSRAAYVGF